MLTVTRNSALVEFTLAYVVSRVGHSTTNPYHTQQSLREAVGYIIIEEKSFNYSLRII